MPAPDNIRKLVERFEEHREAYRLSKYKVYKDKINKQRMLALYKRSPC